MKIVLFTEIYDCGGIDTFIINLINSWPDGKDEFTIIANYDYPGLEIIRESVKKEIVIIEHRITSYEAPSTGSWVKKVIKLTLSPVLKYIYLLYNVLAIKNIFKKKEYDFLVVVNGGYPGGDTCRAASISWGIFNKKKPLSVHNFHNLVVKPAFYFFIQEYIVDKLVAKYTSVFVTVSKASSLSMKNRQHIRDKSIQKYIYNGLSFRKNDTAETFDLRKELGIGAKNPICMILATYEPRKGHFFLLKSFKLVVEAMPNAVLLMFGFGFPEEIETVAGYIGQFGLQQNVFLHSFRKDTETLYQNCDVLLISSQEYESFGLTGIEAMAHNVPIVATNVGGIPEVIKEGFGGYCVDKNDFQSFAEKIILLLSNPKLRASIGAKGYEKYKDKFTSTQMTNGYHQLITQIVSENRFS